MIEALEHRVGKVDDDLSASDVLASIRSERATENAAAARQLVLAARWADLHPPESIHHAATFTVPGCEHEEPIAGEGAPLVAEFCIAELGAVLGMSTTSAKKLIGHALELRHRLPRLWAQVQSGAVPAWKARSVAETTIHTVPTLTVEAAAHVDAQVAAVAGRIGPAQLDRLVAETIKRFELAAPDPPEDPEDGHLHVDPRHATLNDEDVDFGGTMHFDAVLGIADALDLGHAIAQDAAVQKALGSTESLDVRRSKALGNLARAQTALDLAGAGAEPTKQPPAREVVVHTHFDATAVGETTVFGPTGRMENLQRLVLLEQLQGWCADTRTKVTIKPVIDLTTELSAPGYDIPQWLREQIALRDGTCVYPWCTRPARRADVDHIVEYDHEAEAEGRPQPGPTTTSNLAALCRSHHRLKTHSAWTYAMVAPGVFEWTSPHGHRYLRDRHGSVPLDGPGLVTGTSAPSSTNETVDPPERP
ncbi:HNH endonuclease [Nocardioides cavernae]|uniref:HNH endonuclease signature motif containing protein n=1 Tax=Nocardioides cavernae TaxID=1921566 RepID=UPI00200E1A95|nr:HNH endonuclease signature motif containing protein [Nocardioides cavernae]MCK9823705.1 HNH endonuclease [Nocardioides cavernae]